MTVSRQVSHCFPLAEYTDELTPLAEYTDELTPLAEYTDELTPLAEQVLLCQDAKANRAMFWQTHGHSILTVFWHTWKLDTPVSQV